MSNFQCPHCGMINIDCGKDGYKTPREIELENKLKEILEIIDIDKDTSIMSICACCGSTFKRKRKNQKYCNDCSPQKAYKRRISKK